MNFGPYDMLMDFAIISFLLLIAQVLRSKIKLIQNLYLPSSVIAGFMGLILGPYFLNWLPFSNKIASYPYLLIVFLFGSLFLGQTEKLSLKKTIDECGNVFFLNLAAEVGQFAIALTFGGLILYHLFPDLHNGFALLMPAGFCGGHGYAAAIGGSLDIITGWKEALTIGQTFATIGILASIFGGIILINIAARKNVTQIIKTTNELPMSMRTGFIPKDERTEIGTGTVHSIALDPFAWHFALVLVATAGGYYAYKFLRIYLEGYTPAMMSLSMLAGVALILVMKRMKLARYIDKKIITRIGSTSTDYLVGFGIASINPNIVVKYATPLVIMVLLGVGYSLFFLFVITRKLSEEYWFERGIFTYGWTTGVVSLGITLLRIVDPEFRTKTLDKYGMAYVIIALFEIIIVSLTPMMAAMGLGYIAGVVMLAFFFILLGFSYFSYYPRKKGKFTIFRPIKKVFQRG